MGAGGTSWWCWFWHVFALLIILAVVIWLTGLVTNKMNANRSQVDTNKKVLDIVTIQFRKGVAAAADVLRQRQLVASTEASLITAEETAALLQYTLSVLIGAVPETTSLSGP